MTEVSIKSRVDINLADKVEVCYNEKTNSFFGLIGHSVKMILTIVAIDSGYIYALIPKEIPERASDSRRLITKESLSLPNFTHIKENLIGRWLLDVSTDIIRKIEKKSCSMCRR